MLQKIIIFAQTHWEVLFSGIGVACVIGFLKFFLSRKKIEPQNQVNDSIVHGPVIQGNNNTMNKKE